MRTETVATLGAIGGAVIAAVGTVIAKRTRAPGDETAIRRAEQEIVTIALANTKELIQEKDKFHEAQVIALDSRVKLMEERLVRIQASMLAHTPWDVDAHRKLSQADPGWPLPPPIDMGG